MRIWSVFSFSLFLSLAAGCPTTDGQDPDVDAGDAEQDAGVVGLTATDHVCAHSEFGPDESVTAGTDEGSAPTLTSGMKRYTVALNDEGMGAFGGVLLLESAQMGAWHFAFVTDDATSNATFTITQDDNAVMTMPMNVNQCSDLASAIFMADLEMDSTYALHIGGVTAAEARLVVVNPLDGHMHHMDDAGMHHMDDAGMHHMDDAGMHHMNDAGMHIMNDAGMHIMNDAGMHHMDDAGMHHMDDAGMHIMDDAGMHIMDDAGMHIMNDAGM